MFVFLLWIKEAITGLFRNFWWNSVVFLMTFVCLITFSFSFIAGKTAENISSMLKQKLEILIDIKEGYVNYAEMQEQILSDPRVSEVTFISKTEVQQRMIDELGEDADVLQIFEGENIFPAQFVVKVKNAEDLEDVAKYIERLGFAERVLYGEEYFEVLLNVTSKIKEFGFYFTIGGAIFVVLLVIWVIKMNIEQRKDEIYIKQLIGSGVLTIRLPFVLESIILTGAASLAAFYLFINLYEKFIQYMNRNFAFGSVFSDTVAVQNELLVPLFGVALILGVFASVTSTSKHLKKI